MDMAESVSYNHPRPAFNTWDKHNGVAYARDIQKRDDARDKHLSISCTKGLRNAPGENNCFLNSAVQIFWHLDVFRRSFRCLSGHACMGNSCIFCALKAIFTQFQYSDQSSLHPDVLRRALAESFVNQHRFQLGHMDDAAECFENILRRLHFHVANNHNEDICRAPHCIPHQKFAMKVLNQVVCPCGASTEPLIFHEMVHYISATALVAQAKAVRATGDVLHPDKFGLLLRNAGAEGDMRDCPGYCGKKVQMRSTLLNHPDIVSIGLVWDSERPSGNLIADVSESLGTTIMLKDVFHSVVCEDVSRLPKLNLVGLVCFYGKHYSTFIYHTKLQSWMYFDDATVREIGPNWEHVVDKCCRGRYQPLLLLYTNPNGSAISVETAPQKTVMAPEYESYATTDAYNRSSTERLHPQTQSGHFIAKRELLSPFEANDIGSRLSVDHRRQASYLTAMRKSGLDRGGNNYANDSLHDRSFDSLHPSHKKENSGSSDSNRGSNNELNSGPSGSYPLSPVAATSFFRQTPTIEVDPHTSSTKPPLRRLSETNTCSSPVPIVKSTSLTNDVQRKESFKKGNKVRADVIRYQVNPSKVPDDEGIYISDSNMDSVDGGRYSPPNKALYRHDSINSDIVSQTQQPRSPSWREPRLMENSMVGAYQGAMINGTSSLPRRKPNTKHAMSSSPVCFQTGSSPPTTRIPSPYMSSNQTQAVNYQNVINDHTSRQSSVNSIRSNDTLLPTTQQEHQSSGANKQRKASDSNENKKASGNGRGRSRHKKHEKRPRSHSVERLQDIVRYPDDPRDFIDDKVIYIDRKKVESVLSFQNHPFDPESNSNLKHLDEMYNTKVKGEKTKAVNRSPLKLNIPYDSISLESKPDSGYGSSDRNSSSSAGSTGVIDPMAQYFIRRNMIPPKNINQKAYEENMKKFLAHSVALTNPKLKPDSFKRKGPRHLSKQGRYYSKSQQNLSVADSDDISPMSPVERTDLTRRSASPFVQSQHGDNGQGHMTGSQSGKKPMSVNGYPAPVNGRPPTSASEIHNQQSSQKEHFVKMCQHVEDLMDQCVLAETTPDYSAAITYCEKAIGVFMEILNMSGLSQEHRLFAEDRQRSCIGKATNLRKLCQGKLSSSNCIRGHPVFHESPDSSAPSGRSQQPLHQKSDSSSSSGTNRSQTPIHQKTDSSSSSSTLKNQPMFHQKTDSSSSTNTLTNQPITNHLVQNQPIASQEADRRPPVRLGFQIRESLRVDSPVVMDSSKPSNGYQQVPANYPGKPLPRYNGIQRTDSTSSWNPGQLSKSQKETPPTDNGSAKTDIYGTLPKKNSRPNPRSDSSKNTEAYQTYLNHQRALNSHLEASQSQRSSVSSSFDSGGNSAHSSQSDLLEHQKNLAMPSQQHMSKAQIRQLLHQNMKKTLGAEPHLNDNGSSQGSQQQRSPTEINNHQRPPTEYINHPQQRSPTEINNQHLQQHRRSPTECINYQQPQRRSSPTESNIYHQQPTSHNGQPQGSAPQNNGHQLPTTALLESNKNQQLPVSAHGRYEMNGNNSSYHNESFSASHMPTSHHDTQARYRMQPNRDVPTPNHLPLPREVPGEPSRRPSPRTSDDIGIDETSRNHAQQPASRADTPDGACYGKLQTAPPMTNPAWRHQPNQSQQDTGDGSEQTNVRDLRSRFENVTIYPSQIAKGSKLALSESFLRRRSQSESSSLAEKATEPTIISKKSVTFSDNISLIAASESDFLPPMSTFTGRQGTPCLINGVGRPSTPCLVNTTEKDPEEELSDESPVDTNAPNICALCHKNGVQFGEQYCIKCRLYMNRFKSS